MTALGRLVGRRSQAFPRLVRCMGHTDGLVQQPVDALVGPYVRVHGRWLLNFASTNYLGLNQDPRLPKAAVDAARDWGVSLGMPRLLAASRLTAHLERELAALTGQEDALVFPSTTHVALDVLPLLAGSNGVLFVDAWAYPISLAGANAAARRGARIRRFSHNDHRALGKALAAHTGNRDKVIVCDGVYAAGGRLARLGEFARLAQDLNAVVYVDDAHGIGLLGSSPTSRMPYGCGGGGTLCHLGVAPGNTVHVGSLSKAFGVPVAFAAGPKAFVHYLRAIASTFVHNSPPSVMNLATALAALHIHRLEGDALRQRLINRVRHFQTGLESAGLGPPEITLFPIQTLYFDTPHTARTVARALRRLGIWAVLQFQPPEHPSGGALRFVMTATHKASDIDRVVNAISQVLQSGDACRETIG